MSEKSAQAWRRWFGLLFLAMSFGMLVWGQTFLKTRLTGSAFLFYWSVCFLFTFLAIATALLDMLMVRRQMRHERREMLKKTFLEPNAQAGVNARDAGADNPHDDPERV